MRSIALHGALWLLVAACGGGQGGDRATSAHGERRSDAVCGEPVLDAASPCPGGPLPTTLVPIPFAPERPFVDWLDQGRAIVAELVEPPDGSDARVRAFVLDAASGRARALPDPLVTVQFSTGSPNAVFAVVQGRLLVVTYSTVGTEPVSGYIVDPETGQVANVGRENAPPSAAFLTSPRAIAVSAATWAFWPRRPDMAFDFEHGLALDTASATWRAIPRMLEPRHAAHVATVGDGRVAAWGGITASDQRPATSGVVLDLTTGSARGFAHPGISSPLVAVSGSRVATAIVTDERGLRGYVVDVGSGESDLLERDPALSWRSREVLVFDGRRAGYLGADALHVWDTASDRWEEHDLPFDPDAPSGITAHSMDDCTSLLDGTARGAFRVDLANGRFCPVPLPEGDPTPTRTVLVSPRYHLRIGGVAFVHEEQDCPPGAPCAQHAPTRREDPRARITKLR